MILVTGATGLVGSHLVYQLVAQGNRVRALFRTQKKLEEVKKVFAYYTPQYEDLFNQIEWFQADITHIPTLTQAFQNIDYVYHVAAFISFNPTHFDRLKKINVEGTANVINLSLSHSVRKICYVSSIATLGSTTNRKLISEKTEYNPEANNSVYSITKHQAEMEVWRGTQEGLDAVIVHPGVILGAGHYHSASGSIVKSVYNGLRFYTSGGVGIVDVRDVVKSMILLMQSSINNDHFILVGKNVTYKELLSQLAKDLKKEPPKKAISKSKLLLLSKLDWLSNKLFGKNRRLLKATVNSLYQTSFYDASKVKEAINFTFTPFTETTQTVAKHFLNKNH